ncbi:MAG: hypothetical protein JNK90_13205, partial [Planctomycetaceae bacterium]|nr:hypothetical protein [Planctomycetaceae bacterium]
MSPSRIATMSVLLTFTACSGWGHAQTQWPQFRGPGARGVAEANPIPDRWSTSDNVEWKRDIPGRGWSSPVVWNDRIFLTTVVNTGKSEEPKKGLYFGGNRPTPPDSDHEWRVMCLDLKSGETQWNICLHAGKPQ